MEDNGIIVEGDSENVEDSEGQNDSQNVESENGETSSESLETEAESESNPSESGRRRKGDF